MRLNSVTDNIYCGPGMAPASLAPMLSLASALGCVGGISCLSSQQTARLGISVGLSGIGTG